MHVNGELTMGENIADLGGLTLALEAYHAIAARQAGARDRRLDRRPARDAGLGAGLARQGRRDDCLRRQVVSDPHSPRMYRVNGVVRNLDAWYDAFGVKPGDKLYVAPEDRVRIW